MHSLPVQHSCIIFLLHIRLLHFKAPRNQFRYRTVCLIQQLLSICIYTHCEVQFDSIFDTAIWKAVNNSCINELKLNCFCRCCATCIHTHRLFWCNDTYTYICKCVNNCSDIYFLIDFILLFLSYCCVLQTKKLR